MTTTGSADASSSMVISGSIVAVVGIIFLLTIDIAFIMMITFGVAVVVMGLFFARKSRSRPEDGSGGPKRG